MTPRTKCSPRTEAQWRVLIAEQAQSGQTQAAYCQSRGIGYSTLMHWRATLKGKPAPTRAAAEEFIEIPITAESPWDIELQIGTAVVLRLRRA